MMVRQQDWIIIRHSPQRNPTLNLPYSLAPGPGSIRQFYCQIKVITPLPACGGVSVGRRGGFSPPALTPPTPPPQTFPAHTVRQMVNTRKEKVKILKSPKFGFVRVRLLRINICGVWIELKIKLFQTVISGSLYTLRSTG